jgi:hypothetical protein
VSANELDRLVAGLASVRDDDVSTADSDHLLHRIVSEPPRTSRTRRRLLIAAVVAVALVATPALALRGQVSHLFARGQDAPASVAASFEDLHGAPPESRISGSGRLVLEVPTPDGPVRVWAAPHPSGFCYAVGTAGHVGLASMCTARKNGLGEFVFGPFEERRKPEPDWPPAGRGVASDGRTWYGYVFVGFTLNHEARSVRVRFENGRQETVPITWISPPIDAGFFALWTSKAHWVDGWERYEATALDDSGAILATTADNVATPWVTRPQVIGAPTG